MASAERGTKSRLARELGVSRGSLYYQPKLPVKDDELRQRIEEVMCEHPGYGYRRVATVLGINHKRAQRVMAKFGLKPARRAKKPTKRGDQGRAPAAHPDILGRLCPIAPDVVWVSDFTFLSYRGTFLHLATVLDAFTGEPLGFNIARRHDATFVRVAIARAVERTGRFPNWFHSDQGSEYASATVQDWLTSHGVSISMSPKSSRWRNGAQESFFGRFKVEFGDPARFDSEIDLLEALYAHLAYFRDVRIKNKLGMAPSEFRQRWTEAQAIIHTYPQKSTGYESPPTPPSRPFGAEITTTN